MNMWAQIVTFFKNMKNGYKIIGGLLIALVIILSLTYCQKTDVKYSAQQLLQLSELIRSKFNTKPDFWKLNTQWLIDNKILPDEMLDDNNIINDLGKEIIVGSGMDGQVLMPGDKSFDIVYKNLNFDECVNLSSYPFSDKQILGLLGLKIINGKEEFLIEWNGEKSLPLAKEDAEKMCTNKNILIWTFE